MRYIALASDYDGTLAKDGQLSESTLKALEQLRNSGRKLLLITGRHLDDLLNVFPDIHYCDCVVAENGAILYWPATREVELLASPPPENFINALQQRQVDPLGVGKVIVSTWEPHETTVLETIRDLGLELNVIFNKGAVMVLPSGINKATGLQAALDRMGLSIHNVVGVGDAENDHAFLEVCEFSVAVANALPVVQERVDWVTSGCRGEGVEELIQELVKSDLIDLPKPEHHQILMGTQNQDQPVYLPGDYASVLLAGTSGSGKSTLATGLLERLSEQGYQFCIIDPEGDYESFDGAVVLGDAQQKPSLSGVRDLLEKPNQSVILNLLGVELDHRPAFFRELLPILLEIKSRTGHPHWIVVDEVHHLLPESWQPASFTLPQDLSNLIFITVHPDQVSAAALALVNTVIAVGKRPDQTIRSFCKMIQTESPESLPEMLEMGEAIAWFRKTNPSLVRFQVTPPKRERHRHKRNYAEGQLGEDNSFYFRGPEGKLNLRSQNLIVFLQLADGVDDETWLYHLSQKDYSRWFKESIKDDILAQATTEIETQNHLSPVESRTQIRALIEERYTLPA